MATPVLSGVTNSVSPLTWAAAIAATVVLSGEPCTAQDLGASQQLRVFMDCQNLGCEFDLTRREITWVTWVRDREDADVHILVSSTRSDSGESFETVFIGREEFVGEDHTLAYFSSQTDTPDERRRGLIERFKLGLVRYVGNTPAAEFLRITYDLPDAQGGASGQTQVTPENDPWNLWVFGVSVGGSARGQSRTSSVGVNGSLSASRTSEAWKFRLSARDRYSRDEFEFDDGSILTSSQRSRGTDVLLVRSIGSNWGVGGRTSLTSSTFSNQAMRFNVQPALEYNIFPYSESSRRQLTLQYSVGVNFLRYEEETIFGVFEETIYEHSLTASLGLRQPWGSVSVSLTASHFLDDPSKNQMSLFANASFRIVRGLSINLFGSVSRVRDQVFLARRGATDDEVLLRRRALETNFDYFTNISIRYTFGSIFNAIVNPRFDRQGGTVIFF